MYFFLNQGGSQKIAPAACINTYGEAAYRLLFGNPHLVRVDGSWPDCGMFAGV